MTESVNTLFLDVASCRDFTVVHGLKVPVHSSIVHHLEMIFVNTLNGISEFGFIGNGLPLLELLKITNLEIEDGQFHVENSNDLSWVFMKLT